ncbi:unnamed protein product [Eruca vesicaria subsp. sativa]|uniref:Uncharacterized protein n=1 Tax=Eruca vesicaria subsp. sativa TaxID=29727 RepID=A0ABC8JB97_ERUVS|nr:unnamed protein product [Eruca vesicaria subsp. sativa]
MELESTQETNRVWMLVMPSLLPVFSCLSPFRRFKDSEEKREELYGNLKLDKSLGWAVDVIGPRELSAKMLAKNKITLNEISHNYAMGLIKQVLDMGVLLTEVTL